MRAVEDWSNVVNNLRNPRGRFLDQSHKSHFCETHLERINKVGAIAVYPLLMVGYNKLTEVCLKYHLRTQTIGKTNVGEYQKHVFKIARCFYTHSTTVSSIIKNLKTDVYPLDDRLRSLLDVYEPKKIPIAAVILELIEDSHSDKQSHSSVTVEHIMPQTITDSGWLDYICEHHDGCDRDEAERIHRRYYKYLGNLTLLNKNKNTVISNELFPLKKIEYGKTDYVITKKLTKWSHWNADAIDQRQSQFIDDLLNILNL